MIFSTSNNLTLTRTDNGIIIGVTTDGRSAPGCGWIGMLICIIIALVTITLLFVEG